MIDIQCSWAKKQSGLFVEAKRKRTQDNVDWIQSHYPNEKTDETYLVLIGGVDPVSLRIRMAQSRARQDYTPSHWSHVGLLRTPAKKFGNTTFLEIRCDPPTGFQYPPASNAVQEGRLNDYRDSSIYPNVALLRIPASRYRVMNAYRHFRMQRNVISGIDMLTAWLAFVWGATGVANPLMDEVGVPSAVFIEHIVAAAGFDLTPGLASRASCPEAIWQTAKWWYEFYEHDEDDADRVRNIRPISGHWTTPNKLYQENWSG
jgi:hypothetical protein